MESYFVNNQDYYKINLIDNYINLFFNYYLFKGLKGNFGCYLFKGNFGCCSFKAFMDCIDNCYFKVFKHYFENYLFKVFKDNFNQEV